MYNSRNHADGSSSVNLTSRASVGLATTLFFASGALGLGYQLVWIRKAALIVGASQIAMATVLTSFFLGLGIGSLVVARHLRSTRHSPLFIYGLFEAAIGIFALLFPMLFQLVEGSYAGLYPLFETSAVGLFALRFGLIFLLYIVPTFFMGGTLPLLLDGLVQRDQSIGSMTSFLYGVNILGAVAGVLATAYFAIPALGMNGTSIAAGLGNLTIAAIALTAFRASPPPAATLTTSASGSRLPTFYALMGFASGLAAIGYQVLWARYFSLFNLSSVYFTAILLAVYLSALATGSMLLAPLLHRYSDRLHPLRIVATVQPLVAVSVFVTLYWWRLAEYKITFGQALETTTSWSLSTQVVDQIFFAPLFQVGLVIFLPVALLGMVLPSLMIAATTHHENLRASSGSIVFWNTLGSSGGGFAAGVLLIPILGLTNGLLFLSLISIAVGAGANWKLLSEHADQVQGQAAKTPIRLTSFALHAVAAILAIGLAQQDVTRTTIREYGVGSLDKKLALGEVVEGPLATAFVMKGEDERRRVIAAGNQILAASFPNAASTQAIQGHIPALYYPKPGTPERVLGIALGSGQSFGAMLRYPIKEMDIVDISAEMTELSLKHFETSNNGLGTDPRVKFHLDDGRHFVDRAPDDYYDVVSMEPPPPTDEGIHTLYSVEFCQGAHRILRDGGVFMQWLPLYLMTPNELTGIIATQAKVFPNTFVVMVGRLDFMVVSFKQDAPPKFSKSWLLERTKTFASEDYIEFVRWNQQSMFGLPTVPGVISLLLTGPEDIAKMDDSIIYTDDGVQLSYSSGDHELRRYRGNSLTPSGLSFRALPITPFAELAQYFIEPIAPRVLDEERAKALTAFNYPLPSELASKHQQYKELSDPQARAALSMHLALVHAATLDVPTALSWVERAAVHAPQENRASQLKSAQRIATMLKPVYRDDIIAWIGTLSSEIQNGSHIATIREALE